MMKVAGMTVQQSAQAHAVQMQVEHTAAEFPLSCLKLAGFEHNTV